MKNIYTNPSAARSPSGNRNRTENEEKKERGTIDNGTIPTGHDTNNAIADAQIDQPDNPCPSKTQNYVHHVPTSPRQPTVVHILFKSQSADQNDSSTRAQSRKQKVSLRRGDSPPTQPGTGRNSGRRRPMRGWIPFAPRRRCGWRIARG